MSEHIPPFGVRKIKEFAFLLNESLFEINKQVVIQFQHQTNFIVDSNLVDLTLRVYYSYDNKIPPDQLLLDFHVQNVFEINDLKQYQNAEGGFFFPENLIASMLGVAISHTRSLMAQNISGTKYQDNLIPIVNPLEIARAFYPNMFIKDKDGNLESVTETINKPRRKSNKKVN